MLSEIPVTATPAIQEEQTDPFTADDKGNIYRNGERMFTFVPACGAKELATWMNVAWNIGGADALRWQRMKLGAAK